MAALTQFFQRFYDTSKGEKIGIHIVTLTSASDTITVPTLADGTTNNTSARQLNRSGQSSVTITNTANVITIAGGSAGEEVVIVTLHPQGLRTYVAEE
jgi:hypothetical protein